MILKYSVGLDISSKKIDASFCTIDKDQRIKYKSTTSFTNSLDGIEKLFNWISKCSTDKSIPLVVCMEATGVYHEKCAYYLYDNGLKISIVLPNVAKKYIQSLGLKSKNDKIDSKALAQMSAERKLAEWVKPKMIFIQLRAITRQRQSFQEMITALKNQLHAVEAGANEFDLIKSQIDSLIEHLSTQISTLEKEIKKLIKSDSEIQRKVNNIQAVRGLNILSIATVIAETNGFDLFKNYKQLVSYAGYDVVENQSGNFTGKTRISKRGNSRIRRVLHMPSLTAFHSEGTIYESLYNRIVDRTGIKMKGIVAVQKKLLLTIYYLWKNDVPYIKNIQKEELVFSSPTPSI